MTLMTRLNKVFDEERGDPENQMPPMEHDPFLSSTTDQSGILVDISDGLCALLGFERNDLIGQHHRHLLAAGSSPIFLDELDDLLDPGTAWRGDVCHCAKDGTLVWFDCLVTPVRGNARVPDHVVTLRADVSARREIQRSSLTKSRSQEQTGRIAKVGRWELDLETSVACWTDETFRIHGVKPGQQPNLTDALSYYPEGSRETIKAAVEKAAKDGTGWCLDLPFVQHDGTAIWVRTVGEAEFFCGKPRRLFGAIQDITEVVSKQLEVERLNERMSLAAESGSIGIWEYDPAHDVLLWDRLMARLFGYPEASMVGTYELWAKHLHPEDRARAEEAYETTLAKKLPFDTEFRIVRANGEIRHVRATARLKWDPLSKAIKLIGVNWDTTEQRLMANEIQYRATHDLLTGLLNRSTFETRVFETLGSDEREDGALLNIDLDQFKLVNDVAGQAAGDRLLRQFSTLLEGQMGVNDTVARLGSDEFAVLLTSCPLSSAEALAAELCRRLDEFRFQEGDRRFRVSASVGVVALDGSWTDVAAVLHAANAACGAAKDEGGNRVRTWSASDRAVSARTGQSRWASRIEQALDEDRFELYAQLIKPIKAPAGPIRAEILLRMIETDGTLISPGVFVRAAERFYLASRIDRWVLKNALSWLGKLERPESVGTVCINLSGQSIGDRVFHRHVVDALRNAGPEVARKVCLEITETSAITNLEDGAAFMTEVRALGVRIALDDFGSGNSSFGYLRKLPIDYLKIDGQFIRELTAGSLEDAAVRCFTEVARLIGVQTVAEFIETQDVLDHLAQIGVDWGQGYLLHKPTPISEVPELAIRSLGAADEHRRVPASCEA